MSRLERLIMKKAYPFVIFFAILFLFFIQMTGTLVASIYTLDLMHTSLDAKVLGLLFFFSPILLLPFGKKIPNGLVWTTFSLLFLARGASPYMNTLGRMLASGLGTGCALILFSLVPTAKPKGDSRPPAGLWLSCGLALAVCLSVLLRTLNFSIDYSLTPAGGWLGWGLGLLLGLLLTRLDWIAEPGPRLKQGGLKRSLLGIFLVLVLVIFAFSAPAVITRWTEGNYALIVIAVCLLAAVWAWLAIARPQLPDRLGRGLLLVWNLFFALSLAATILAHRVAFPRTPGSPAVLVGTPAWWQQVPLVLMLLLFPVIFLDLRLFVNRIRKLNPTPRDLVPGLLLGSAALVLLIFVDIFTNVWGYIAPVSTPFRNMFWLPFLLSAGGITLLAWGRKKVEGDPAPEAGKFPWGWTALLGLLVLGCAFGSLRTAKPLAVVPGTASLRVMTYNIQAANDAFGEQSYDRQLALIRQVSPDILALQESDTARISLNNNDYVRYYASRLGYYSYYGPTTVTGTFGTAILSKYPLQNTHAVFSYSDTDEIGTAEAEIEVTGRRFNLYDIHPDGSDITKLICVQTVLEQSRDQSNVIVLGDFNLRESEAAYQLIAGLYTNAWVSVYPSKISPDGIDMSGSNRIDHIFVSPSLGVRSATYILPPASATDHPVHWAEIVWGK
jgi:endonuclease/exonuclease/phosphatase family metal-dependent hydrolase